MQSYHQMETQLSERAKQHQRLNSQEAVEKVKIQETHAREMFEPFLKKLKQFVNKNIHRSEENYFDLVGNGKILEEVEGLQRDLTHISNVFEERIKEAEFSPYLTPNKNDIDQSERFLQYQYAKDFLRKLFKECADSLDKIQNPLGDSAKCFDEYVKPLLDMFTKVSINWIGMIYLLHDLKKTDKKYLNKYINSKTLSSLNAFKDNHYLFNEVLAACILGSKNPRELLNCLDALTNSFPEGFPLYDSGFVKSHHFNFGPVVETKLKEFLSTDFTELTIDQLDALDKLCYLFQYNNIKYLIPTWFKLEKTIDKSNLCQSLAKTTLSSSDPEQKNKMVKKTLVTCRHMMLHLINKDKSGLIYPILNIMNKSRKNIARTYSEGYQTVYQEAYQDAPQETSILNFLLLEKVGLERYFALEQVAATQKKGKRFIKIQENLYNICIVQQHQFFTDSFANKNNLHDPEKINLFSKWISENLHFDEENYSRWDNFYDFICDFSGIISQIPDNLNLTLFSAITDKCINAMYADLNLNITRKRNIHAEIYSSHAIHSLLDVCFPKYRANPDQKKTALNILACLYKTCFEYNHHKLKPFDSFDGNSCDWSTASDSTFDYIRYMFIGSLEHLYHSNPDFLVKCISDSESQVIKDMIRSVFFCCPPHEKQSIYLAIREIHPFQDYFKNQTINERFFAGDKFIEKVKALSQASQGIDQDKYKILTNLDQFCHHFSNMWLTPKDLIEAWVKYYANNNNGINPLVTLAQHSASKLKKALTFNSVITTFKPMVKFTSSIQLILEFVGYVKGEEDKLPAVLRETIENSDQKDRLPQSENKQRL